MRTPGHTSFVIFCEVLVYTILPEAKKRAPEEEAGSIWKRQRVTQFWNLGREMKQDAFSTSIKGVWREELE